MAKRPAPIEPDPRHVRSEGFVIPPGETTFTIDLNEATVEELASGVCSEHLAQIMHDLLSWKRDAIRQIAREKHVAQ